MTQDWASREAGRRIHYTGEPFQHALNDLRRRRFGEAIIPAAAGEQAVVESMAMELLCRGGEWWPQPLSVTAAYISDTSLLLKLGSHTLIDKRQQLLVSDHAMQVLLPVMQPDTREVEGIPGLRVEAIRDEKAEVCLASESGDARLILRGVLGTRWADAIRTAADAALLAGTVPLWEQSSLDEAERDGRRSHRRRHEGDAGLAWLGSGLLRRIALFGNSSAYSIRMWISAGRWHVHLYTSRSVADHRVRHDEFLARLADDDCGLPLMVTQQRCSCDRTASELHGERDCVFELQHRDRQKPGTLHLTCRWDDTSHVDMAETLRRAGANSRWIERVLPTPGRPAAPDRHELARGRALFTGETAPQALRAMSTPVGRHVILPAGSAQAQLESLLLNEIGSGGVDHAGWRPGEPALMISKVVGDHDSLTLHVPSRHLPKFINRSLPWHIDDAAEIFGITGLRCKISGSGVTLYRIGLPGRIDLRGISKKQWQAAVAIASSKVRETSSTAIPCWIHDPYDLTPQERAALQEARYDYAHDGPVRPDGLHELMSAVLRRLRILDSDPRHTGVSLWQTPYTTVPTVNIEWGTAPSLDTVAAAFQDRIFGIPGLTVAYSPYSKHVNLRHDQGAMLCLRFSAAGFWNSERADLSNRRRAARDQQVHSFNDDAEGGW
ncbi:hypothetical protein AB0M35_14895 [Micromonospora sp. NPDC051196]|uniref:hypothetical protein n=1 Tax=Micromonospora sp. NPDC051196 TaxID=3155281 RepID=UPI00343B26BF